MLFTPNYKLNIITEESFPSEIEKIEKALIPCRNSGYFKSFDNKDIYFEYFLADNAKATVVMVHGLSEFTRKFYETVWYFLNMGYNVFIYDQRGHGLSCREAEPIERIHINRVEDYVADIETFIDNTVAARSKDLPIYMFAHSMGGAVGAMYLATHQGRIDKAVLSSPLIKPQLGRLPLCIARTFTKLDALKRGNTEKSRNSKDFNPNPSYSRSSDISRSRFDHNMKLRISDKHYQSTPMSNSWVYEALSLRKKLVSKSIAGSISTPILLLSAEKDTVVCNKSQALFANKCKTCTLHTIKGAKHSMYSGNDAIITEFMTKIIEFYG